MTAPVPPRRPDPGVTTVELVVASLVAGLLLGALGALFTGVLRTVGVVGTSTASVADARLATGAVERTLRVAVRPSGQPAAVIAAAPAAVEFWALLNRPAAGAAASDAVPAPTRVRYAYDAATRCLTQTLTAPGATPVTTCLARTTSAPAFTYYASATDGTDGAPAPAPLPAVPSVAAADLPRVQAVRVQLTLQDPSRSEVRGVPVVVQVALQNVVADAENAQGTP